MKYMGACRGCGLLFVTLALQACDAQVDPNYRGEPLLTLEGRVAALRSSAGEADVGVLWLTSSPDDECSGPVLTCSSSASGQAPSAGPGGPDAACLQACGYIPECTEVDAIEAWAECQRGCGSETEVFVQVQYEPCFSGAVGQTAPVVGDFPAQFSLDMLAPPPSGALTSSDTLERVALGFFVALAPDSGPFTLQREMREPPAWLLGGSESHVLIYAGDPVAADSTWGKYLGGAYPVGYHLVQAAFGNRCGLPSVDDLGEYTDAPGSGATGAATGDSAGTPYTGDSSGEVGESSQPPLPPEPDYTGVPLVCGNGACEDGESCEVCSDCACGEGGAADTSTGLGNLSGNYFCMSTPGRLLPSPAGSEAEIQLLLAPPRQISWPTF